MDVALDERHIALGKVARALFETRCPLDIVRQLEVHELGYLPELWREMANLDWLGMSYPESAGGAGAGITDLAVLYIEMGRALIPSPHLSSAVICGHILVADASRGDLVAEMIAGEAILAPALVEESGEFGPHAITLPATPSGAGYRLSGTKLLVPYAHVARHLLVSARTPDGVTLFLVDPAAAVLEQLPNIAGYPLFAVTFDGVEVGPDAIVGTVGRGHDLLGPALDRATVLRCAEIAGAGEALLDMTVTYAKQREQFGQPIGRFQAVQYLCSDIAIDSHLTTLLSRRAAWTLDQGHPGRAEVAAAKAYASRAAQHIVHCAHEIYAGMAFMLEADVQLFTRRAKHWEFDLGDADYHDDVLAGLLETG
ncbi:alkylation response protein AidB-like acyl-CoA dehydrogenase [Streptosporangium album]|uniref:Alkylation response protein AidB-like acyl-CoA dehydrogenase n=1 Tax=Streptosporangium album TaxID=47479 RepID=A0A7W7WF77_9ACTN|nr:acyl-CoA dehydrogenase family protein [Streptosporangium album]MBB4944190.1 alkylation response protein AidB-like acyl-CoA dehydrogenase [Streptosporangium album]